MRGRKIGGKEGTEDTAQGGSKIKEGRDGFLLADDFKDHLLDDRLLGIALVVIPADEVRLLVLVGHGRNHDDHDAVAQILQDALVDVMKLLVSGGMAVPLPHDVHVLFLLDLAHVVNFRFLVAHPRAGLDVLLGLLDVRIHDELLADAEVFLAVRKQPAMHDVGILVGGFFGKLLV